MLNFLKFPNQRGTKISHRESSCFLIKALRTSQIFTFGIPLYNLQILNVLKPWTLLFKKDTITASYITVTVYRGRQKNETYLKNEESGLPVFKVDLRYFFDKLVCNEFGLMLRGKDLTNQNLLFKFYANSLSWCTHTLFITISLATQKLHCCVALLSFQSLKLETF